MSTAPMASHAGTGRARSSARSPGAADPAHRPAGLEGRRDRATALLLAAACATGMAATWALAALVPALKLRDAIALQDFVNLGTPRVEEVANGLLHLLDPAVYVLWALLLVAAALVRRRPRAALAVVLALALAPFPVG